MKDDLQKWLDLDIELIEEKPLTDIQTKKIKQAVLGVPKRKKQRMKTWITVAAAGFTIITTSYFTLPSIASQLPFIKNMAPFVNQEVLPQNYEELAAEIGDIQTSNGIDMMIESAVYDGTNVIFMFVLNTERDLGEQPILGNPPLLKKGQASWMSSSSSLKKIDKNTYVGVEEIAPHFDKEAPQEVTVQWNPQSVKNREIGLPYKGDWSFEFKVPMLKTTTKNLAESSEYTHGKLTISSITYSDLAAVVDYEFQIAPAILEEWPRSTMRITEVTDNFGRSHLVHDSGGVTSKDGHGYDWKISIYTLSEDITSLTFTPVIHYGKNSVSFMKTEKMEPITIQIQEEPTN